MPSSCAVFATSSLLVSAVRRSTMSCEVSFECAFWAFPSEGGNAMATANASSSASRFEQRLSPECKPILVAPGTDFALSYIAIGKTRQGH